MDKFIKLTLADNGKDIYVNTDHVVSFKQEMDLDGLYTALFLVDCETPCVKETPEEIMMLIRGYNEASLLEAIANEP